MDGFWVVPRTPAGTCTPPAPRIQCAMGPAAQGGAARHGRDANCTLANMPGRQGSRGRRSGICTSVNRSPRTGLLPASRPWLHQPGPRRKKRFRAGKLPHQDLGIVSSPRRSAHAPRFFVGAQRHVRSGQGAFPDPGRSQKSGRAGTAAPRRKSQHRGSARAV